VCLRPHNFSEGLNVSLVTTRRIITFVGKRVLPIFIIDFSCSLFRHLFGYFCLAYMLMILTFLEVVRAVFNQTRNVSRNDLLSRLMKDCMSDRFRLSQQRYTHSVYFFFNALHTLEALFRNASVFLLFFFHLLLPQLVRLAPQVVPR